MEIMSMCFFFVAQFVLALETKLSTPGTSGYLSLTILVIYICLCSRITRSAKCIELPELFTEWMTLQKWR